MNATDAVTALRRFGLGPRPGEVARIGSDPRGFVLRQLQGAGGQRIANLPTSDEAWREVGRFLVARRERRMAEAEGGDGGDGGDKAMLERHPNNLLFAELAARVEHAVTTDFGLIERLVGFWSNHFTVALQGPYLRGVAGAYEREAIRPHVLGHFRTMLHAVVHHPAMLSYLSNVRSIGPNSTVGQRTGKGLNENLAREILELHTVGVSAGYTQQDVTGFARALTGWTVHARPDDDLQGRFWFLANRHEPGPVTVMGRRYPEGGIEQAEAILDDLAAHPATARHIARKLAVHFVGETAPSALVERLAAEFRQSDGDLAAVMRVLATSDEAWSAPAKKVLPPYDFVVAVFRALEDVPEYKVVWNALREFGQPPWNPEAPAGWPDEDEAWASPHGMIERLDWVSRIVARSPRWIGADIAAYAESLYGDVLSAHTRQAVTRAESRDQALALLFMAPEFQRR